MEEEKKKTTPKKKTATTAKKSTGTTTKKTTGTTTKKAGTTAKKSSTTTTKKASAKKAAGTTAKKTATTAKKKAATTKKATVAPKKEKVEVNKEVVTEPVEVKSVEVKSQEEVKQQEVKPEVVETKQEEVKKEEVNQEPKFQKVTGKQKTKKSKGKKFLIFILILLILTICGLGVWAYFNQDKIPFLNKSQTNTENKENKKNEIKEWEKAYAKILTDENNYKNSKNYFIQLVSLDKNSKVPTLLVIYDNATVFAEKVLDIWQVDENGEVLTNGAHYNVTDDGLKVLYDIEKENYNWYIYHRDNNNEEYKKLSNLVNETKEGSKLVSKNSAMQNYMVCTDGQSGNILKEDFEKQFIVVDTKNLSKTWVPFKADIDESAALELVINEENKNKNASSVVSEIKDELFKKADKIKEQNKQVEKVEENV